MNSNIPSKDIIFKELFCMINGEEEQQYLHQEPMEIRKARLEGHLQVKEKYSKVKSKEKLKRIYHAIKKQAEKEEDLVKNTLLWSACEELENMILGRSES